MIAIEEQKNTREVSLSRESSFVVGAALSLSLSLATKMIIKPPLKDVEAETMAVLSAFLLSSLWVFRKHPRLLPSLLAFSPPFPVIATLFVRFNRIRFLSSVYSFSLMLLLFLLAHASNF